MNIKQRIFIAGFLAAVVGLLVWYVVRNPINSSGIIIDQQSTDRLTTVNRVMTSLLGKHWSLLLFVLAIMLVIVNVKVTNLDTRPPFETRNSQEFGEPLSICFY